jgi:hypothetical protein
MKFDNDVVIIFMITERYCIYPHERDRERSPN